MVVLHSPSVRRGCLFVVPGFYFIFILLTYHVDICPDKTLRFIAVSELLMVCFNILSIASVIEIDYITSNQK